MKFRNNRTGAAMFGHRPFGMPYDDANRLLMEPEDEAYSMPDRGYAMPDRDYAMPDRDYVTSDRAYAMPFSREWDIVEEQPSMMERRPLAENRGIDSRAVAIEAQIQAELAEIRRLDPSITSLRDILAMPNAEQFRAYVRRGNSFLDAFYLANRDELMARQAAASTRHALNNARNKAHLTSSRPQGGGAPSIPSDELRMFWAFNPDASEAEIQRYYTRYMNAYR